MKTVERELSSHLYPTCNTRGARSRPLALLFLVASLLTTGVGWASSATAPLSAKERALLENHKEVSRRMELKHNGRRYVTAISYGVAARSCDQVFSVLSDPGKHYTKALPATAEVKFRNQGRASSLWMKHGNAFINGSYTAHFKTYASEGTVRFWLDKKKDRDVQDLFGYFKVSSWGSDRCLVTAAVAVDPGEGLVASMFRGMISDYVAKSAGRIQRYTQRATEPHVATRTASLATVVGSR